MNQILTSAADHLRSRLGRLITQALAWARAFIDLTLQEARALLTRALNAMDQAQRAMLERLYERRMAVRRMFLVDPRDVNSEYTAMGRKVLAHWARNAHALAPVRTSDPIEMARAEGKREFFALILSDLFDDLPDFAQLMAQEEARMRQEMIA